MLPKWLKLEKKKECNVILSAGGIRSLAHIGALQALEEEGWKIKNICGISAGAIVSAFYASGIDLKKIEQTAVEAPYANLIKVNFPWFHKGLFRFNGLGEWVANACLRMPESKRRCTLCIAACSIVSGRRKLFTNPWDKELLKIAIEGTCSVPVLFPLTPYGDDMLADGALWSSAPIHYFSDKTSPAYNTLPTFVINVQDSHNKPFTDYYSPTKLLNRVFEVFQMNRLRGLRKRIRGKKICVIEPHIPHLSAYDFKAEKHLLTEMVESGKRATLLALNEGKFDG